MSARKPSDFRPVGSISARSIGLPARRARELALAGAWARVAGARLARHVRPVAVRRGVLELEVAEGPWLAATRRLLPRLAGRLSALDPGLGVRRFRIRVASAADEGRPHAAEPIAEVADADAGDKRSEASKPRASEPVELEALARRYVRRVTDR